MTVGQIKREMSARELSEWYALYSIEADEREERERVNRAKQGAEQARAKARR